MAKVTFRRGEAALYKSRWSELENNGTQEYAYLKNAIYFATDTHELYLDGANFTFDSSIDFSTLISDIDYDSSSNSLKISYSDVDKADKQIYLSKVAVKKEGPLSIDVSIGDKGEIIYELELEDLSEMVLANIESYTDNSTNIQNGDTISVAFSKINDSISWVDVDEEDIEA